VTKLPLPQALFVLGHDESGRARSQQPLLDAVVAGGLAAELVIAGTVRLDGTRLVPAAEPDRPRPQQAAVLDAVADGCELAGWLSRAAAGTGAYEELAGAGLCERESSRRMGMFRVSRLRFADPTLAARTTAWFTNALVWSEHLDPTDAILAALGRELAEPPPAYLDLTADQRQARTQRLSAALDAPLRHIVNATHHAIAALG
jgi:Golgi phosphoprotein 3 GPP34